MMGISCDSVTAQEISPRKPTMKNPPCDGISLVCKLTSPLSFHAKAFNPLEIYLAFRQIKKLQISAVFSFLFSCK